MICVVVLFFQHQSQYFWSPPHMLFELSYISNASLHFKFEVFQQTCCSVFAIDEMLLRFNCFSFGYYFRIYKSLSYPINIGPHLFRCFLILAFTKYCRLRCIGIKRTHFGVLVKIQHKNGSFANHLHVRYSIMSRWWRVHWQIFNHFCILQRVLWLRRVIIIVFFT